MRYASFLALSVALAACNPKRTEPQPLPTAPSENVREADISVDASSDADEDVPAIEPAAEGEIALPDVDVAAPSNALGFDLYAKIRAVDGNLAFSPASVMAALAMTHAGADGATREELTKVLRLDPNVEHASAAIGKGLSRLMKENPDGLVLRMANRLFGDARQTFKPFFLKLTGEAFGAYLDTKDFRTAPEQARIAINDWVARETAQKIRDLVPKGLVTEETRLVLVNAVYFLGKWSLAFEKERTYPEDFYLPGGAAKKVPMMHATGFRRYGEAEGVKLLELDYRDRDFAMLFVLPKAKDGLAAVEARLSPGVLEKWVGALSAAMTTVTLPKFTIEPGQALALSKPLKELGMEEAFDRNRADFSRMAKAASPAERLFVGEVFHKAFVAVDEEGTEAAAATAAMMAAGAAPMRPEDRKEFRADHPFLFFLRHKPTGLVLFMGRVAEPTNG